MTNPVVVSVCMITYNHEQYIRQAIESILMQKTNFKIELVIGEDCSSDKTRQICEEYALRYSIVRLLPSDKNLGVMPNFIRALNSCVGYYTAFCEGDDYWVDPLKLQKQVDFLEQHSEYSLCFHNAIELWENNLRPPKLFVYKQIRDSFETKDVIENEWFIPTQSMVIRSRTLQNFPSWINNVYNGDYAIVLLVSLNGKMKYMPECMSVYRRTLGSLSKTVGVNPDFIKEKVTYLLDSFNKESNYKFHKEICLRKRKLKVRYRRMYYYKKFGIFYLLIRPDVALRMFKKKYIIPY